MFGNYVNEADYDTKPPGWDVFVDAFVGPGGFKNRAVADELTSDNAVRYARKHAGGNRPLFQWVSYFAPHYPFDYEPRFANRCQGSGLPPSPAIDEDTDEELADKPQFIRETAEAFSWNTDERIAQDYKDRCRALQTPDEGLRRIVNQYRAKGELSETYFVFGTDNGYLLGEHGLKNKQLPYLESARFPLIVRGPGVARGTEDDRMVSNVDIMPTFLDIANVSVPGYVDGESMLPVWKGQAEATVRDVALVEGKRLHRAPSYSGLVDQEWTYTEWADGSKEYYDLTTDPYQLENSYEGLPEERKAELSSRLEALKDCAGSTCRAAE
jgi:arylsulfatase A-like enzyme